METYLYINGFKVNRPIILGKNIKLLPCECSPSPNDIIKVSKSEVDLGITTIFLRRVYSQLKLNASTPRALAILAWNSLWEGVLLSAIYDCEAVCNFQCDIPAEKFDATSDLKVTNYHLRGLQNPYELTEEEAVWLETNIEKAKLLLKAPEFLGAIHSLASYRWHPHPRARLALIWAGIEGLFKIESEIVFRLSLYVSRFLAENDESERRKIFSSVKKLYKHRSHAVHGVNIKENESGIVLQSRQLLNRLIHQCIIEGSIPDIDRLAP